MKKPLKLSMLFGLVGLFFSSWSLAAHINLNTADAKTLSTLKGVGQKRAEAIVAYRTEHGAFKKIDDLVGVKGISEKRLAKLEADNPGMISLKGK